MYDLAIMGGQPYIDGNYTNKNLYIKDGMIACMTNEVLPAKETYHAAGKKVLPGFIDPHVHFALGGGRYTSCDDFYSGSISAAYGGITTYIDFLDPIARGEELEDALRRRQELAKESVIDYGFHTTIKNPQGQVPQIVDEMKRLALPSVKLFTTYSDSGRRTYDNEIIQLLQCTKSSHIIVLAHIEADDLIDLNPSYGPQDLLKSRCSKAETKEALKLAELTRTYNGKLYMVHLSSGYTLRALKEQYSDILNKDFIVESCPHYFSLSSTAFEGDRGYAYTMAPPLRSEEEVMILNALFDDVYTIGTDHCPFMKNEKNHQHLLDIPMGIGGVEHSFRILYAKYGDKVIDKMTINPAKVHGLYPRKGVLQVGSDADVVIYDPDGEYTISSDHSRCDYSVFEGKKVMGRIESTISRGNFVIKHGAWVGGKGIYLERT
ncbi:amidohydrolase family protein [Vallitalea pronyensis]|uniref:Amidohydrolase family protein n=1 Tax=Vallitalea pronyensis TaxID=1348613 RepID=A0A8J8SHI5_9FIRM|nr:amidohydrolase family protein [Vallitalea pronyensis]QUI23474.1 amidohydrolase family protein [Vallitalea pronyensis]